MLFKVALIIPLQYSPEYLWTGKTDGTQTYQHTKEKPPSEEVFQVSVHATSDLLITLHSPTEGYQILKLLPTW